MAHRQSREKIIPFLQNIKQLYGQPLASVHDMAKGISNAVREVFPDSPDFICHYHFLSALGKNLFGKENDRIRARLRKHGIQGKLRKRAREYKSMIDRDPAIVQSLTSTLEAKSPQRCSSFTDMPFVAAYAFVLWALEGKKQAQGYGYPFDRANMSFYQRLKTLHSGLTQLKDLYRRNRKDTKAYVKVLRDLIDTMEDSLLRKTADSIQDRMAVFDTLREAMRIAMPKGHCGLNDRGDASDIHTIEKAVDGNAKQRTPTSREPGRARGWSVTLTIAPVEKTHFCVPIM